MIPPIAAGAPCGSDLHGISARTATTAITRYSGGDVTGRHNETDSSGAARTAAPSVYANASGAAGAPAVAGGIVAVAAGRARGSSAGRIKARFPVPVLPAVAAARSAAGATAATGKQVIAARRPSRAAASGSAARLAA